MPSRRPYDMVLKIDTALAAAASSPTTFNTRNGTGYVFVGRFSLGEVFLDTVQTAPAFTPLLRETTQNVAAGQFPSLTGIDMRYRFDGFEMANDFQPASLLIGSGKDPIYLDTPYIIQPGAFWYADVINRNATYTVKARLVLRGHLIVPDSAAPGSIDVK